MLEQRLIKERQQYRRKREDIDVFHKRYWFFFSVCVCDIDFLCLRVKVPEARIRQDLF